MYAVEHAPSIRHERWGHAWLLWAIFLVAVVVIVNRPWQTRTVPAASTLHESDFSAERAWPHVEMLATTVGRRLSGTEGSARAADYIDGYLRSLGLQPMRQEASGSAELNETTYVYRGLQNVLVRIAGRSARAILVSIHYDSAVEGSGAGDNALNVAAALEVVRATMAGAVPANTIIFNFNDGEELGLLGSAAFVRHPWFKEVAAFINLDASGPGGRQLLLQVTPGRDDLLEAYAASAQHVHGTILAQEIFGALPFDTDYHVYRDAGLGGIDLAPYGDGYAYHTPLDRAERLSRQTLQESGENVLALLRGIDARPPSRDGELAAPATYYDLLGLVMVRYSARIAQTSGVLVAAVALLLVGSLGWPVPSGRRPRRIALGAAAVGLSGFLAILTPLLGGVLVARAGYTMFWYARPWIALCVYGTLAAGGVLAGQSLLRRLVRRRGLPGEIASSMWRSGLVVFWAVLLLTAVAMRLGSAYLPMWWSAGVTIAFVAATRLHGSRRWIVTLAGVTLAAITTLQAADLLLTSMVPLAGMLGADAPAELLIAAITALAVAPFALLAAPEIPPAPSLRRLAASSAAVALVIVPLVLWSFPYTEDRPKRAYLDVKPDGAGGARVVIEAIDPGPDLAIEEVALDGAIARSLPTIEAVKAAEQSPASQPVAIRLSAPGAHLVEVTLDGGTIAWPNGGAAGDRKRLVWVGTDEPLVFGVASAPGTSVIAHAKAFYVGSDVSVDHVLAQLPRWSAPTVQTVLETTARIIEPNLRPSETTAWIRRAGPLGPVLR